MNNAYDPKKAILDHIKKHFYLGIALGLLVLAIIFMLLPFVHADIHEILLQDGTVISDEAYTMTISGFDLSFGAGKMVEKTINGVVSSVLVQTQISGGAMASFVFILLALVGVGYVYLTEKNFPIAFVAAGLLLLGGIFSFAALPLGGYQTDVGSSSISEIHNVYTLGLGAVFDGILLIGAAALIVVDYILVYIPAMDDSSYVKYKQELVDNNILLSVRHLKVFFPMGRKKKLKAVHDVSFDVKKGECFGLVGESGCGKTTTGRSIIRLHHITSGSIYFKGYRIAAGSRWNEKEIKWSTVRAKNEIRELLRQQSVELENIDNVTPEGKLETENIQNKYREKIAEVKANLNELVRFQKQKIRQIKYDDSHVNRKLMSKMQMIFQDPIDSLDPRMTVEDIIQEGLKIQKFRNRAENHQKACSVLEEVGLIADYCSRYPNEFSGGQRQRIGIARAIVMNPEFMICDEPISALDVSIRAQIINLLNDLKENHGLTLMFIAHDLSVVKYFCDRIAVMYFGEMVELATSDELFAHPLHPYTRSLLSAIPRPDPLLEKKRVRMVYNPSQEHDYSVEKPTFQEILPGHFVLANSAEIEKYKQMIIEDDEKIAKEAQERKEKGLEY